MDIVCGKGSTEFGIGRALCALAQCILRGEKRVLPVSALLCGEYGQSGLHCGVPCLIGRGGVGYPIAALIVLLGVFFFTRPGMAISGTAC